MDDLCQQMRTLKSLSGITLLLVLFFWETASPFFILFRHVRERARHALRNFAISILNGLVVALLFVTLWAWAANWSLNQHFGLLHRFELPPTAHALLAVLLLDAWTYLWHWLNHRIPFLWRFHRTHHSDAKMDVTTANRFHLGEIGLSSLLRVPLILALGVNLWELVLYESLLQAANLFQHSNIGLPEKLDRILRVFIVTPAMHKVHHSRSQPETDSNYSSFLSIWDRIFRTLRLRADPHTIQFGVAGFDAEQHQTLAGILKTPLADPDNSRPEK